jgi:hypothetical protein
LRGEKKRKEKKKKKREEKKSVILLCTEVYGNDTAGAVYGLINRK